MDIVYKNFKLCKLASILFECIDIDSMALGGSRARGIANENSDYDLFCVIYNHNFDEFRKRFASILIEECKMCVAAEQFYLENWGYLFKAFDQELVQYDISIIPDNRIDELGIKKTNIILFDKSGLYSEIIKKSGDDYWLQEDYAKGSRMNIVNKIVVDLINLKKNIVINNDYWNSVKYIERIRRNIMIIIRMNQKCMGNKYFSPERKFDEEINCEGLEALYKEKNVTIDLYYRWKEMFRRCCLPLELERFDEILRLIDEKVC